MYKELPAMVSRAWLESQLLERSIPEPNSGCLLWLGQVTAKGYGKATIAGSIFRAHRLAWAVAKGQMPPDRMVCHRCDVPSCINPAHLFLGTAKDNAMDMARKGRAGRHRAKITPEIVRTIRADPRGTSVLARTFGLSASHTSNIRRRKAWRHLA